jgi:hypothetical protein
VVEAEAVIAGLPLDAEIIEGEVEVLHSRELANAVVDRLKLREHPEFNAELAEEDDGFSLAAVQQYLQSQLTAYAREFWESFDNPEAELNEGEARERRDKESSTPSWAASKPLRWASRRSFALRLPR